MSSQSLPDGPWLERLQTYLKTEGYTQHVMKDRERTATLFVRYLRDRRLSVEGVSPRTVDIYLRGELRSFRRRHGRAPSGARHSYHRAGVHMFLRLVQGVWPPPKVPATPAEECRRKVVDDYARWMERYRGLATSTMADCCSEARAFLVGLGDKAAPETLGTISVADIDAYLTCKARSVRRVTLATICTRLRSFLRYLHISGYTRRDLAPAVVGPRLYAHEGIPSALRAQEIAHVLKTARADRSPIGLRDYAILTLLATYGLRAGEITALRFDDIDWRRAVLRIRHSKTGASSELPLLQPVGDAVLRYLRHGRPRSKQREVFLRQHAPLRAFRSGSSLYTPIRRRLADAHLVPAGKKGPHAFRHARAISLLRAAVPLKEIGDLLGHRSSGSTTAYLKLATEDLRDVALEIPTGEVES